MSEGETKDWTFHILYCLTVISREASCLTTPYPPSTINLKKRFNDCMEGCIPLKHGSEHIPSKLMCVSFNPPPSPCLHRQRTEPHVGHVQTAANPLCHTQNHIMLVYYDINVKPVSGGGGVDLLWHDVVNGLQKVFLLERLPLQESRSALLLLASAATVAQSMGPHNKTHKRAHTQNEVFV